MPGAYSSPGVGKSVAMTVETVLYDAEGNETDDRADAVRGEVIERDDEGRIVKRYPDLGWATDDRALQGDAGEVATRPERSED
jgi:hypothetical protein